MITSQQTTSTFTALGVLSKRELEARFEVCAEQYATKLNIECETAAEIARTMIMPAAVAYIARIKSAKLPFLAAELEPLVAELHEAIVALEYVNRKENQDDHPAITWAHYMRDRGIPAMSAVRSLSDRLEKMVPDNLWPLPKYSEMLFIK